MNVNLNEIELDLIKVKPKKLYVKINCDSIESVRNILLILENNNIDKNIITISV